MKVVIATPLYPPEIGGPATYAEALSRELPKRGIAVDLVKFADVRYLPKLARHMQYYRNVLRAGASADAVLVLDPVSVGLPALYAARKLKKPLVVKIVGDYAWEQGVQRFGVSASLDAFVKTERVPLPVRVLRRLQTRVAAGATRVIVPSDYLRHIVASWGIALNKIETIYNAVPMEMPGGLPEAIAALPRPLVVSVGRLVPWKGFESLISAVATVREHGVPASLAIVGDGPDHEAVAVALREALGVQGIYLGQFSHPETLAILKNADAFVLNSSYEGLSHTLIEALSLGVPVIATRAGGNGELVNDGENGILIPVGDTPHLARTLLSVLGDREMAARLSRAAKASVGRFAEARMVEATAKLLTSL